MESPLDAVTPAGIRMPVPENEAERLTVVKDYNLVHAELKGDVDNLVALAKRIFKTKIALLTVLDEEKQHFRSNFGLDDLESTPRSISFCSYAIMNESNAVFVVLETLTHPMFMNNPLVIGPPYIRFYAGAPLEVHAPLLLPSLCILYV
jgi:GAF domain-containing protein